VVDDDGTRLRDEVAVIDRVTLCKGEDERATDARDLVDVCLERLDVRGIFGSYAGGLQISSRPVGMEWKKPRACSFITMRVVVYFRRVRASIQVGIGLA